MLSKDFDHDSTFLPSQPTDVRLSPFKTFLDGKPRSNGPRVSVCTNNVKVRRECCGCKSIGIGERDELVITHDMPANPRLLSSL